MKRNYLDFFLFFNYYKKERLCAGIVQLVEHLLAKEDVARSSRVTRCLAIRVIAVASFKKFSSIMNYLAFLLTS